MVRIIPGDGGTSGPGLVVEQPDDCTRLSVLSPSGAVTAGAVLRHLAAGGPAAAGHVWIEVAALRARARSERAAADWDERFLAMLAYAGRSGWLDPGGTAVKAHVVADGG